MFVYVLTQTESTGIKLTLSWKPNVLLRDQSQARVNIAFLKNENISKLSLIFLHCKCIIKQSKFSFYISTELFYVFSLSS